jgi:hypothetical protein
MPGPYDLAHHRRSHYDARRFFRIVGRCWKRTDFRQSEIQHLHRTVGLELDVGRFQVAMNDALLVHRL